MLHLYLLDCLSPDKARIFTFQSRKYFKDLSSGKYSFMLTQLFTMSVAFPSFQNQEDSF